MASRVKQLQAERDRWRQEFLDARRSFDSVFNRYEAARDELARVQVELATLRTTLAGVAALARAA